MFDRCMEFGTESPYLIWLIVVVVARLTFGLTTRAHLSTTFAAVSVTVSMLVAYFVTPIIIMVVGYGVVGCSAAAQFWPTINQGHQLHDKIKGYYQVHGSYPDSQASLAATFDADYSQLELFAKVVYQAREQGQGYTLMIRPSRYLVAVYDSQLDFGIYYLDHPGWFRPSFTASFPQYPPTLDRQWPILQ